jgi:hypothetical protein
MSDEDKRFAMKGIGLIDKSWDQILGSTPATKEFTLTEAPKMERERKNYEV